MAAPSWNDLARIMKGSGGSSTGARGPSAASSIKSESDFEKKRGPNVDDDYDDEDLGNPNLFPPPKRSKEDIRRARRDGVTGWVHKGRHEDGTGGVNIIRKDETMISLALEGKTTLDAQLKVCGKPIIGLDYVVEFQDPEADAQVRVYHCTLCTVFRTAATILEHICSYHHRVRTLRKQFPSEANMFLCADKKTINRNPALMTIASKRAAEHELVYGRGEFEVRHERPSFPDKDMDNEESDEIVIVDTKQLEYLQITLKEMKTLKINSAEEVRVAKAIMELLSNKVVEYSMQDPSAL